MLAFIDTFWKPILAMAIIVLVGIAARVETLKIRHLQAQVAQYENQLALANKEIGVQNAAIDQWKIRGADLQRQIDEAAEANKTDAQKVVVKWKTKYLPQPIPADCSAGVAVAAENAASVARIFMSPQN